MSNSIDINSTHKNGKIDAIVLAGGEARRMQGQDKGLILWRDKPLIAHVLACISPQVRSIVISANRNLSHYANFGYPVVRDLRPDFQGPLAGIEACAAHCQADYTLIVSCDTPRLPIDLTRQLMATLNDTQCTASFVDDGKRQHYLITLLRTPALATVSDYLNSNQRSVKGWLDEIGAKATSFTRHGSAFHNINQPADL